ACTARTRFKSERSMQTPPRGALTWPSSDVPVPKAITGTRSRAQMRTMSCTSAVLCGNTTASGGWFSIQVVVLACCSRTACEVTRGLPNFCASARTQVSIAARWRRVVPVNCCIDGIGRALQDDATLTDFLRGEERPVAISAIGWHLGVDPADTPSGGSPQRPDDRSANRISEVAERFA